MPRRRIEPTPNFRLQIKRGVVLGPGKVALLEHIAELGSISQAGKAMQMSYRTAWALVNDMNDHFIEPLVERSKGGTGGGGASLTPLGMDVLRRYRAMERRALKAIGKDIAGLEALIRD
jgi:molybdate transport system regulatory protein